MALMLFISRISWSKYSKNPISFHRVILLEIPWIGPKVFHGTPLCFLLRISSSIVLTISPGIPSWFLSFISHEISLGMFPHAFVFSWVSVKNFSRDSIRGLFRTSSRDLWIDFFRHSFRISDKVFRRFSSGNLLGVPSMILSLIRL